MLITVNMTMMIMMVLLILIMLVPMMMVTPNKMINVILNMRMMKELTDDIDDTKHE